LRKPDNVGHSSIRPSTNPVTLPEHNAVEVLPLPRDGKNWPRKLPKWFVAINATRALAAKKIPRLMFRGQFASPFRTLGSTRTHDFCFRHEKMLALEISSPGTPTY